MKCPHCGSNCNEYLQDGYIICCRCNCLFSEEEAEKG